MTKRYVGRLLDQCASDDIRRPTAQSSVYTDPVRSLLGCTGGGQAPTSLVRISSVANWVNPMRPALVRKPNRKEGGRRRG